MATVAIRGVVRGGVVQLDQLSPLAEGTEVVVTPVVEKSEYGARGSAAAIIASLAAAPKVPSEWVDELEALIEEGRRPSTFVDPFADFPDPEEEERS